MSYEVSCYNSKVPITNRKIILLGFLLFLLVTAGYAVNRVFIFAAFALIAIVAFLGSVSDCLIPFVLVVTWGAEIWALGNGRLYTIIRLLSIGCYVVKLWLNGRIKIRAVSRYTIVLVAFCLYTILGNLAIGNLALDKIINLAICYLVVFLILKNESIDSYSSLSVAFGAGVALSSLLSFISAYIPSLNSVVRSMMLTYNVYGTAGLTRMSGMTYDPNLFGFYAYVGIAANLCLAHRKKYKNCLVNIVLSAILSVLGIMTLSKAFFLVFALLAFVFVLIWTTSARISITKKMLIFLGLALTIVLVFTYADVYLEAILERFSSTGNGGLTTGRSDLWTYYLNYLFDHPLNFLFGKSLSYSFPNMSSPHNYIVYMLFHYGVVGFLVHFIMLEQLSKSAVGIGLFSGIVNKSFGIFQLLPLFCYFIFSLSIDPFMLYDVKMVMLSVCFLPLSNDDLLEVCND